MVCKRCGAVMQPGENFCYQCGWKAEQNKDDKLPIIIALLAAIGIIMIVFFIVFHLLFSNHGSKNQEKKGFGIKPLESQVQQTEEPPAVTPASPEFSEVVATGYRESDKDRQGNTYHYFPHYATDGDWSTCWGVKLSYGETPSITLRDSIPQHVTGIRFSNGYFHTQETYVKNRRITKARISYVGGSKDVVCGLDQYGVMQEVIFDEPVDTTYITIQILESVDGGWHDISISEIEVF